MGKNLRCWQSGPRSRYIKDQFVHAQGWNFGMNQSQICHRVLLPTWRSRQWWKPNQVSHLLSPLPPPTRANHNHPPAIEIMLSFSSARFAHLNPRRIMAAPGKMQRSKVAFASSSASSKLLVSNSLQVLHGRPESASPIIVGLCHELTHNFRFQRESLLVL